MGYYLVKDESINQKLTEFTAKLQNVRNVSSEFVKSIQGASELFYERADIQKIGGVAGILFKKGEAPPKGWVKRANGSYYPSLKKNAKIFYEMANLPSVDKQEINDALSFKPIQSTDGKRYSFHPGIDDIEGMFIVEVESYVDGVWIPPVGVEEITSGEYRRLMDLKKRSEEHENKEEPNTTV